MQAPQNPAPHPNFVPVICNVSRRTQSNGVSGETLTFRSLPFTRRVKSAMEAPSVSDELTMVPKMEGKGNSGSDKAPPRRRKNRSGKDGNLNFYTHCPA